jgi:hypothetical protein
MSGQPGKNHVVAFKAESVFNTPVSGAGATQFRFAPSSGLSLKRAEIVDPEVRKDGMSSPSRLGSKAVAGSYVGTLSQATFEGLFAAVLRANTTWTAAVAITQATMTSITTTTSTIVAAAGSWITQGVRVGDIVVLTGHATTANNSRNLRVTAVSASTITVAETLTTDASPDTTFTLTIQRKVTNPATLVRTSFTVEEYSSDLDDSELFSGCRVSSIKLSFGTDAMVQVEIGFVGANMTIPGTAASPNFTSPTLTTTVGLVAVDSTLRLNGADVTNLTSLEVTFDLGAQSQAVIGSLVTPDVFEGQLKITGSFTAVRTALTGSNLATFLAETDNVELHLLMVEPMAEPKNFVSMFLPRLRLLSADAPIGNEGALMETVTFSAAAKATTSGYDTAMVTFCTAP